MFTSKWNTDRHYGPINKTIQYCNKKQNMQSNTLYADLKRVNKRSIFLDIIINRPKDLLLLRNACIYDKVKPYIKKDMEIINTVRHYPLISYKGQIKFKEVLL